MLPQLSKKHRRQKGQAVVEYVVTIVVVVGLFNVINYQIQKGIIGLWQKMAKEVASACPKCPPTASFE